MKGNSNGEKSNGIENLMIEFYEYLEQEQNDIAENNKIILKILQKNKNKQKRQVIIIEEQEQDSQEEIKTRQLKDTAQILQKQNTTKNYQKQSKSSQQIELYQKNCISSFQENLRVKQKKTEAKDIKETEMETDDNCDIKKLEIFHLLKISQNFILSMNNLTEKIIKMYV